MRLVFCGTGWFPVVDAIRDRLPPGFTVRIRDFSKPIAAEVRDAQVILPSNAPIGAAEIEAARDLVLIQQPAAGFEGIDVAAAERRAIPVCNAPGANAASMAEAALLLLLAVTRRISALSRSFATATIGVPLGRELDGKTLGLIGRGRTGERVAAYACALGMRVLFVRSSSTRDQFLEMIAECDAISIHCPLTPATHHLFDRTAFARMKPGAILINCARGAIVERAAVEEALASGRLAGLGLDVFWHEPWDPADPLFAREDVVTLPHAGGSTVEAFGRIADIVVENVRRIARGEPLLFRVR